VHANGTLGFAQYKPSATPGRFEPWAVHLLEVADGRISSITNFVGAVHFERFGLPDHLDANA
jgi:RNA polymerase sigma-70 factor (ECF subfamily)